VVQLPDVSRKPFVRCGCLERFLKADVVAKIGGDKQRPRTTHHLVYSLALLLEDFKKWGSWMATFWIKIESSKISD
jgi:hypothetical protein